MDKVVLTHNDILAAVSNVYGEIRKSRASCIKREICVYGVPRGGVPIAYLLKHFASHGRARIIRVVDDPALADVIVDDVLESGRTARRYAEKYGKPFFAAFEKGEDKRWLVFPWEVIDEHDGSAEDTVVRMLERIGEDPKREGLQETPARVVKAWDKWFSGYGKDPTDILKVFEDGAQGVDELVLETDIPVYSHCEHHLAPIFGVAHVAYIPSGSVVGLSKLVRLVDVFARRLQVQERLTNQIADAVAVGLKAKGVGVVLQCRHLCMESRGVSTSNVVTTTSALRGALKDEPDARMEFLTLIQMVKNGGPL